MITAQTLQHSVEVATNLFEVSQCPEKAPTRLKVSTSAFTITNIIKTMLNGHLNTVS